MESTGRNILLFERDGGLQRIITLILKQAGFQVTRMNSLVTVLDWLDSGEGKNGTYLLILDISGIGSEGGQRFRELQNRTSELPVIIIAPYGDEMVNPDEGLSLKHRILTTPFSPEELMEIINEISNRDREFSKSA